MGQYANFYNSINKDRVYDASSFEEWLKPFFKTGVFNGNLQVVESSGMNIKVGPGNAFIEGKLKYFENETILTIDAAHATYSRIDNVIVRRNDVDRDFTIMIQKGTNSNAPAAPTPIRQDGIYDVVIAQIYVQAAAIEIFQRNITDTRANGDLCGWVVSNVKEVDFDQIAAQFTDYFNNFKNTNLEEFNSWFETIKGILGEDEAVNLLLKIQENEKNIQTNTTSIETLNQKITIKSKMITINPSQWEIVNDVDTYLIEDEWVKNNTVKDVRVTFPKFVDVGKAQIEAIQNANIKLFDSTTDLIRLVALNGKPSVQISLILTVWG